jgi:hypothetical protein
MITDTCPKFCALEGSAPMAVRKMSTALAIFSLMGALSYGFARLSRVRNQNAGTVALSQVQPLSGRVYSSPGDLIPGEPADMEAGGGGGGETSGIWIPSCGANAEDSNYVVRWKRRTCSLLREVDPRLYRLEYLRAAPEPLDDVSEPK